MCQKVSKQIKKKNILKNGSENEIVLINQTITHQLTLSSLASRTSMSVSADSKEALEKK